MGLPIVPDSERAAQLVPDTIRDLSTTRVKRAWPSGAKWVNLSARLLPGATATANQVYKVVINATSDADATGRLALDGAFIHLFQGDDLTLSAPEGALITRLDIVAEQAVGTEKTIVRLLAGV